MAEEQTGKQPGGANGGGGSERRAAPRYQADLRVMCHPVGLGSGRTARVRNISQLGIGLVVDRHWGAGTVINVELPLGQRQSARLCPARVIHATAQPGGCFLVGCVFETPLTSDELQVVLAGPA